MDAPRHERAVGLAVAAALLVGLGAAFCGRRLPAPQPADAAPELVSAGRMRAVLDELAAEPHPVGSARHELVRERLLERLRALGHEPEEQRGERRGHALVNVLVRVPGTDPTGTLLCLAHYDSVPTGPGAGDDGVGTASWLEALRALGARGWKPRNDVVFLWSDGEELGLLGADLFADEHPLAAGVRTVVNLEAIGNGGPAVLFELGPENGARVSTYAAAVDAPTGTSLADAVYRRMPNDTDLTVFLRRGISGFNLAITSGSSAYHAPHDTPAHLDPRSQQHMAESALALAEALGSADLGALDGPDVTFFDLLGRGLVVYPRAWDAGVLLVALAGVALLLCRAQEERGSLWLGLARFPASCLATALCAFVVWWILDRVAAWLGPEQDWVTGNTTSATLLLAGLALGVVGLELRRATGRAFDAARARAALVWFALAAVGALVFLRGASFALSWPLVLAAAGALAFGARARAPARTALLLALPLAAALVLDLPILHLLVQLFQRSPGPAVLAATLALAVTAGLFAPHWWLGARVRGLAPLCLALGALALAGSVVVARLLVWRQGAFWP